MIKFSIVSDRRVSSTGARNPQTAGRVGGAVPINIPPLLRRFWDFTRQMAKKFSHQLMDPEKHEDEFIKVVRKDFEKWS